MGAMIIGIFSGLATYAFLGFLLIIMCYLCIAPVLIIRFILLKRPIQKQEWYKILKGECIFYGVITLAFLILTYGTTVSDNLPIVSSLLCLAELVPTYGAVFCIQWLILKIPNKK